MQLAFSSRPLLPKASTPSRARRGPPMRPLPASRCGLSVPRGRGSSSWQLGAVKEGGGADLDWGRVASNVRDKLSKVVDGRKELQEQLQAWLSEVQLQHSAESDAEKDQVEIVAQQEAENMGLEGMSMDVGAWLGGPADSQRDSKMAGVLCMRLLQAFHKEAGVPFDDEDDDCYWRLGGFIPGALVDALDHETLKRLIRGFSLLPFSGA